MEAVLATRDSSNELGIETIGAHPMPSGTDGAAAGEFWSRNLRDAASVGAADVDETPTKGMSALGRSLI